MHLYYAQTIAENLLRELQPYCDIIHIAGSIRRQKPEVKDIEIVCIPKKFKMAEKNLFGEDVNPRTIIHPEFEKIIKANGTIGKGKFTGRYMQLVMQRVIESVAYTINLDLFMPQQHDYYRQLAIRTGSAEYVRKFISGMWVKKGWCGSGGELYLQKECCCKIVEGKNVWSLKGDVTTPTMPPVWKSEQEFFKWLGVQWLEPQQRSL